MKRHIVTALSVLAVLALAASAWAHCQIPCGIYDDELRVRLIEEHITTVEKSMAQIIALGKESPVNHNQLAQWVANKEHHAQEIQDIVTAYLGPEEMDHRFRVLETLVLRVKQPGAVCVFE